MVKNTALINNSQISNISDNQKAYLSHTSHIYDDLRAIALDHLQIYQSTSTLKGSVSAVIDLAPIKSSVFYGE